MDYLHKIRRAIELKNSQGFKCNWKREIYYHMTQKKVISYRFLEEKAIESIENLMQPPSEEWQFYFIEPPSDGLKNEIIKEIEFYGTKCNCGISTNPSVSSSI
jgi:hypothetical protein